MKRNKPQSVYIPKLDAEHGTIRQAAEDLHQALAAGGEKGDVRAVVHVLMQQINAHFASEERMMRSSAYPSYDWHKRQHDTMRKRMQECEGRADVGDHARVSELLEFFEAWLGDHTGLHDRMMSAYLRNFEREQRAS
ncbi:MAG: hemerythrin family protein [Acidobacteriia bacterium]|nr:hemerythrin family protein [Terriglobia bacterium]